MNAPRKRTGAAGAQASERSSSCSAAPPSRPIPGSYTVVQPRCASSRSAWAPSSATRSGACSQQAGGLLAIDVGGGQSALQHVHVGLDEPRQHRVALKVDDLGAGRVVAFELVERADSEDRGAADRERLADRVGVVHR